MQDDSIAFGTVLNTMRTQDSAHDADIDADNTAALGEPTAALDALPQEPPLARPPGVAAGGDGIGRASLPLGRADTTGLDEAEALSLAISMQARSPCMRAMCSAGSGIVAAFSTTSSRSTCVDIVRDSARLNA